MKNWLTSLISDEKDAVRNYTSAATDADKHKDKGSAALYRHIRGEEMHHRDELTDHLHGKGEWLRRMNG
jgi:rubrerythrin